MNNKVYLVVEEEGCETEITCFDYLYDALHALDNEVEDMISFINRYHYDFSYCISHNATMIRAIYSKKFFTGYPMVNYRAFISYDID